jgi:hypothetical protein
MLSKNCVALMSLLCIACPLSAEAAIYKCTNANAVVYQDTPCKAGQTSLDLAVAPIRLTEPNNAGPAEMRQEPLPPSQLQSTALALGMSDTEVLNLRGWRRPGKITRSKANRAWREEWTYFSPQDEQKQLQFVNGKLAAIL